MSLYSEYKKASPEMKISIIRGEMIPVLVTIKTYTDSIRYIYNVESNAQEIERCTTNIIEAVENLERLREILIEP
jgi:hypothetical protein